MIEALERYATWEPVESPRARAMRDAAVKLREAERTARQSDSDRLNDPRLRATGWQTEICEESKELRLTFFGEPGCKGVLCYVVLETVPEVYDLGSHLLSQYDKLEGLE